ncbi:MAG: hypothetical protein ABEL51_14075 [Salinibacter sp.]
MSRIRSFRLEGRPDFRGTESVNFLSVPDYGLDLEAMRSDYGFELKGLKTRGLYDDIVVLCTRITAVRPPAQRTTRTTAAFACR